MTTDIALIIFHFHDSEISYQSLLINEKCMWAHDIIQKVLNSVSPEV